MIGYNRLGSNGFLGNQMFQYASLRGIADNMKYDWVVPPPNSYYDANYGLFECFKMGSVTSSNFGFVNCRTHESGVFNFDKELFDKCPDDVNLNDFFQTEKYFQNIKNVIKSDYTFKDEILECCKPFVESLHKPIFLHVRRGDYLNNPNCHPTCPIEYYEKALSYFDNDCEVIICSNDIKWCKNQKLFSSDRFHISEGNQKYIHKVIVSGGYDNLYVPYYDLCLMSLCNGGIIANSSLSWWGAWLIDNLKYPIIAPKEWFGPNFSHYNMNDLFPENWSVVSYE
jgi:hypothetical protein